MKNIMAVPSVGQKCIHKCDVWHKSKKKKSKFGMFFSRRATYNSATLQYEVPDCLRIAVKAFEFQTATS